MEHIVKDKLLEASELSGTEQLEELVVIFDFSFIFSVFSIFSALFRLFFWCPADADSLSLSSICKFDLRL